MALHCGNGSVRRFYLKKTIKKKQNPCTHTQPRLSIIPQKGPDCPQPIHQTTAQLNIERTIKPNAAMVHRWQKSDMVTQGYLVAWGELIAAANRVWEP